LDGLGSSLAAAIKLALYLVFTFALMPVQVVLLYLKGRAKARFPVWYHRRCLSLFGFKVKTIGDASTSHPTLFIANHTSYLDIIVLSSFLEVSFVAKTEVATWPLFGWLAKLQRTVFVDRKRNSTETQRNDIADRLKAGDNLVLFPEGTSNDGNRVLPFKSALFSVAEIPTEPPMTIQPVSIAYTKLNGIPLGRALRPFYAWYGDMALAPHLVQVAGMGSAEVTLVFHPPVALADFGKGGRKALAAHCHKLVSEGVAAANAGRIEAPKRADD